MPLLCATSTKAIHNDNRLHFCSFFRGFMGHRIPFRFAPSPFIRGICRMTIKMPERNPWHFYGWHTEKLGPVKWHLRGKCIFTRRLFNKHVTSSKRNFLTSELSRKTKKPLRHRQASNEWCVPKKNSTRGRETMILIDPKAIHGCRERDVCTEEAGNLIKV